MVVVVELSSPPGTIASYARAALGLIPGAVRSGHALPQVEIRRRGVVVDPAHLAAYSRVCGFRLADTLPATYPHVLAFPLAMRLMTAPNFPLRLIGLLHIANRITVSRPIPSDAKLDLSVRAVDLRAHPRGRQFDLVATATADGHQVWSALSTYLRLEPRRSANRHSTHVADLRAAADNQPGKNVQSLRGPVPPSATTNSVWHVSSRVGARYATVSADHNPIHTSRLGARLFGFPGPIAHGMWSMAHALATLEGCLPDSYTVDVAMKRPLVLPCTANFVAARTADGWSFTVASGQTHLAGVIYGPQPAQ